MVDASQSGASHRLVAVWTTVLGAIVADVETPMVDEIVPVRVAVRLAGDRRGVAVFVNPRFVAHLDAQRRPTRVVVIAVRAATGDGRVAISVSVRRSAFGHTSTGFADLPGHASRCHDAASAIRCGVRWRAPNVHALGTGSFTIGSALTERNRRRVDHRISDARVCVGGGGPTGHGEEEGGSS